MNACKKVNQLELYKKSDEEVVEAFEDFTTDELISLLITSDGVGKNLKSLALMELMEFVDLKNDKTRSK